MKDKWNELPHLQATHYFVFLVASGHAVVAADFERSWLGYLALSSQVE